MPTSNHKADQSRSPDAQSTGVLSVVATPIGNLGDFTARAIQTLNSADLILAEDTRHSRPLLNHYGITTRLKACHEHNEAELVDWTAEQLAAGKRLALISDAGTPLISDPGFVLIRALRERGCQIEVVPGASSIIAALSVAGLPTDSFVYEGFLPAKSSGRRQALEGYLAESRTVVLLESSHRIEACIVDICAVLGEHRQIVVARELTKKFETVISGPAQDVLQTLREDSNQQKGEFVVLLAGVAKRENDQSAEIERVLRVLLTELPLKQSAALAAKLCGAQKNEAYKMALALKDQGEKDD